MHTHIFIEYTSTLSLYMLLCIDKLYTYVLCIYTNTFIHT